MDRQGDEQEFHYESGQPIFDSPAEREQRLQRAHAEEDARFKREQLKISRQSLLTQVFLVVFGLLGVGVGAYQAHLSKIAANAAAQASKIASETLREMQTGSGATDTHTLAQQATTQAAQTTALARAAVSQASETKRLADNALQQAISSNTLAREAQRSADYAQQSIQTSVESDRPWVGLVLFTASPFEEGKTAIVHMQFENTGKRPAIATVSYAALAYGTLPIAPNFSGGDHSEALILPGASISSIFEYVIKDGAFAKFRKEHLTIFFVAEVVYTDPITMTSYITRFCNYYDPRNKQEPFPLCTRYNEAR